MFSRRKDAFLTLRDTFRTRGLTVKLYTRDERIPFDWYGAGHQPIMVTRLVTSDSLVAIGHLVHDE